MSWKDDLDGLESAIVRWFDAYRTWANQVEELDVDPVAQTEAYLTKERMIMRLLPTDDLWRVVSFANTPHPDVPYMKTTLAEARMAQKGGGETDIAMHIYFLKDPIMGKAHKAVAKVYKKYHYAMQRVRESCTKAAVRTTNDVKHWIFTMNATSFDRAQQFLLDAQRAEEIVRRASKKAPIQRRSK